MSGHGTALVAALPTGNRQAELRGTTLAVTLLATFFVGLRFVARTTKGVGIGRDDWTIVVSLVFLYGCCALDLMMIHYGLGLHASVLEIEDIQNLLKMLLIFECVYCTTVGIIKISLLLMYGRIFHVRWFRIASWCVAFATVGWVIAINFVSIFQCTPIRKAWMLMTPGTCINLKASFIGNGVPNFMTDIIILTLPMPVVWKLHTSFSHRLSLSIVFLLGSFVVFASIYRFTTLFEFDPTDTSWTLATACTWCVVECAVGIVSTCLPTLRPLMKSFSTKFKSTVGGSTARAPSKGTAPNISRDLVTIGGSEHKNGNRQLSTFQKLKEGHMHTKPAGRRNGNSVVVNVENLGSRSDSRDGDEIPLNQINVRREVDLEWSAASVHENTSTAQTHTSDGVM